MCIQADKLIKKVTITENVQIAESQFCMTFQDKLIADLLKPGQFINVKIPEDSSLILRRPFSIFNVEKETVSMVYMVVGKGSKALSHLKPGWEVEILGPLGNGFTPVAGKAAYIVGGGCGTPPVHFLAKNLKNAGYTVHAFLGFSKKEKVILLDDFRLVSDSVHFSTDDGSAGEKGNVISMLEKQKPDGAFYACGPAPLLSALKKYCTERNLPLQVSVEERMGCGFGVCLGCAIKTPDNTFKYVCKDGPVFEAKDVIISGEEHCS